MATIIHFPADSAARADREALAEMASGFRKNGIGGERADALAREILADYREFNAELARVDILFPNTSDQEAELLRSAAKKFGKAAEDAWWLQRLRSAMRKG